MILRCRFGEGMNDSSANFHATNEASDLHPNKGFHRQYEHVFENGELVRTVLPDFARDIDQRNDWREPGEQLEGDGFEAAGESLKKLILWIIQSDQTRPRKLSSIARRAVSLAFAIAPGECGETWPTMLAAAKELRCTRQSLSKYNAELSRLAHGRFQRANTFAGGAERAETSRRRLKQWDGRRKTTEQKHAARLAYEARKRLEQSLPMGSITETPADHTSPAV